MSLREELLAIDERPIEEFDVPGLKRTKEGGNPMRIRALSGAHRDVITNLYMAVRGAGGRGAVLRVPELLHELTIVYGVVDAEGKQVFTEEDAPVIAQRWGESIAVIHERIINLSGMAPASVEDAAKNSQGDLNANSGSGSPSSSGIPSESSSG